jgi:hypothetical protein
MFKSVQWFMDRLVERLVPLIATSFSSTVETMHALGQAEQQDQLEEAARRYEADGKTDIARVLRRRAAQLTSTNPAAEATEIFNNIGGNDQALLPPANRKADTDLGLPPNFADQPSRQRKKKAKSQPNIAAPLDLPNPASGAEDARQ